MQTSIQRMEPDNLPSQLPNSILAKENCAERRIAHIDDDPDIRDTVRRILNANGYIVDYKSPSGFQKSSGSCNSRCNGGNHGLGSGGLHRSPKTLPGNSHDIHDFSW